MTKLNKELIAQEAFKLIDEIGFDAFSMRALAGRMGVGAMSIYTYYPSRDELLEAVHALLRTEFDNAPVPGEYWEDSIRRTTASIRATALRHPNAYTMKRGCNDCVKVHTRRIYKLHHDQGIPLNVYSYLWPALEAFITGAVLQEINQINMSFEHIDPNSPDYEWMKISQDAYSEESFKNGIELIIKGVRSMDPNYPNWRTPEDRASWTWQP